MVIFTPEQMINLVVSLILLIPAILLFRNYQITGIGDYLLFSVVFFASTIGASASVLVTISPKLIFYQLNVGMLNLTFYLLFLHGIRLKYSSFRSAKFSAILGLAYLIFLTILIGFWKIQTQPDKAFIIFTEMRASTAPGFPHGAGIKFNGHILYSTSYYLLGLVFWIFVIAYLLWAYLTVEVVNPTENIVRAKKLWILAWSIELLWAIFLLPIFPQIELINLMIIVSNLLILYIALKYPESLLLSNDQLVRAQGLFDRIIAMEDQEEKDDFGMDSLVNYLQSIPEDINQ